LFLLKKKTLFISSIVILSNSIFDCSPLNIFISVLFLELELEEEIELFKIFLDFLYLLIAFSLNIFTVEN